MKADIRVLIVWLLFLVVSGCEQSGESEQGFAGLGAQAEGFEPVKAGSALRFPDDHLPHPQFRIEWWYVTANLKDQQGRDWGVQWTLFRQAMQPQNEDQAADGWASAQVWLGHAALSNENLHLYADRLARGGIGQAGVSAAPFDAWIDHWSLTAPDEVSTEVAARLGDLRVRAEADSFAYDLRLRSDGPLVLHGDAGLSRKSQGRQASYYYSQPFYRVEGMLEVEGEPVSVTGQAWLDREWSSQPLAADQRGWDWFSLHLEEGSKLMLFRLRSDTGSPFASGSWTTADGTTEAIDSSKIFMQEQEHQRVAGRKLPVSWRLRIPSRNVDLQVKALNAQAWMGTSIPYWEGPVRISGSHDGKGYLEMTGY